jgi:hypothetical protein
LAHKAGWLALQHLYCHVAVTAILLLQQNKNTNKLKKKENDKIFLGCAQYRL